MGSSMKYRGKLKLRRAAWCLTGNHGATLLPTMFVVDVGGDGAVGLLAGMYLDLSAPRTLKALTCCEIASKFNVVRVLCNILKTEVSSQENSTCD